MDVELSEPLGLRAERPETVLAAQLLLRTPELGMSGILCKAALGF